MSLAAGRASSCATCEAWSGAVDAAFCVQKLIFLLNASIYICINGRVFGQKDLEDFMYGPSWSKFKPLLVASLAFES